MAYGSGFQDFERLRRSISGDVFDDSFNRGRYATDASIYQMMPHAVVIPKQLMILLPVWPLPVIPARRYCHVVGAPRNAGKRSIMQLFWTPQNI